MRLYHLRHHLRADGHDASASSAVVVSDVLPRIAFASPVEDLAGSLLVLM